MNYSAGFTKEKWSEDELEIVIPMMLQGMEKQEIFEKVAEENLFQLKNYLSVQYRFDIVHRRARTLSDRLKEAFVNGSDFDKKALTLFTFLLVYRFPMEFYREVVLDKYAKKEPLYRGDFHDFFETKAMQDEKAKSFRPETVKRLILSMMKFFKDAGLLQRVDGNQFEITPLHLSQDLKAYAEKHEPLLYSLSQLEKGEER